MDKKLRDEAATGEKAAGRRGIAEPETLRDLEQRFGAVFNGVDDALFVHEQDGAIIDVNERMLEMYKVTREQALSMSIAGDLSGRDNPLDALPGVWARVCCGEVQSFPWRARRPGDGSEFFVEVMLKRIAFENRDVVLAIVRDVTRRRLSEEALKRSETRFRTVADFTYDWEFWMRPDGSFEYVSPSCRRVTGRSESEFLQDEGVFQRVLHPEDRQGVMERLRSALAAPGSGQQVFRVLGPGNGVRWVSMAFQPVTDSEGGFLGLRGSIRDITANREAEEELRAGESRYRMLFEQASEGIILADDQGAILEANPLVLELLGLDRGEILGRRVYEFLHPGDMEETATGSWMQCGATVRTECRLRARDGSWVPVAASGKAMGGNLVQIMFHDLTESKRLEQEKDKARRMADEANAAKDEFLAGVSHEIRTPISGILGMTEMLLAGGLTREQRHYLEMLKDSAKSLMALVNDILDYSKIEARKLELRIESFNLWDMVSAAVRPFAFQAEAKGVNLDLVIAPDTPRRVRQDPLRLGQVLRNLLGNAVKFTAKGEVQVMVEPAPLESGGPGLLFSVRDTGIGIAEDKRHKLFQSFSQADGDIARKYGGTGLGLAISKRLVEMMGGTIWYESRLGQGSTFQFTMGFEHAGLGEEGGGPEKSVARDADGAAVGRRPLTVLLAEDNQVNRTFLSHVLSQAGHNVLTASNGREALDVLARHRVDVALMDVQMPVMDGVEATRRIRGGEVENGDPRIPVIALTAYVMAEDRDRFLAAGMDDYLAKPVDAEELLATLARRAGGKAGSALGQGRGEGLPFDRPPAPFPAGILGDREGVCKRLDSFKGRDKVFADMARSFIDEVPMRMLALEGALAAGDQAKAGDLAHSMVSSALAMGAAYTAESARSLEQALRSGLDREARSLCAEVRQGVDAVTVHLESLLLRVGAGAP